MYGNYTLIERVTVAEYELGIGVAELALKKIELEHNYELYSWIVTKDAMELADYRETLQKANKEQQEDYDERVEYLEEQIEKLKEQNREVWGKEGLRDFESKEALLLFLASDNTDKLEWTDTSKWVCTDFALQLMKNAAKEGYRLFPCLMWAYEGNTIVSAHYANIAHVDMFLPGHGEDSFIIAVEPQTDEIFIVGRTLDPTSWRTYFYPMFPYGVK